MKRPKYNEEKLAELILYVCHKSEADERFGATKLNKILFYSDFAAYRQLGQPITGADYQNLEEGPAPRKLPPIRSCTPGTSILLYRHTRASSCG